jgi:hypothetical protein
MIATDYFSFHSPKKFDFIFSILDYSAFDQRDFVEKPISLLDEGGFLILALRIPTDEMYEHFEKTATTFGCQLVPIGCINVMSGFFEVFPVITIRKGRPTRQKPKLNQIFDLSKILVASPNIERCFSLIRLACSFCLEKLISGIQLLNKWSIVKVPGKCLENSGCLSIKYTYSKSNFSANLFFTLKAERSEYFAAIDSPTAGDQMEKTVLFS